MSWTAKQSCPHCDWEGLTRQQFYVVAVLFSYLAAGAIALSLELDRFLDEPTVGGWIIVIVANLWFYALPGWLLRRNACPSCRQRFAIGATKAENKPDEPSP